MMYHVTLDATEATKMGVNSLKHQVELDLSSLTESQRTYLSKNVSTYNNKADLNHSYLLDSTGNLTPESIQTAMDKEQDDINKTFERFVEKVSEKIQELENDPTYYVGNLFDDYRCKNDKLSPEQIKDKEALLNRVKELQEKYAAEKKAKVDAFVTYITPLIEKYEKGDERPEWYEQYGEFIGPQSLLDRILKEDQKRSEQVKEAADKRKYDQLTEVINLYGTDLQKRKWACDMMERKEALNIMWLNTFRKGTPISTKEWKSDSTFAADIEDLTHKIDTIEKLSDNSFESYEKIKNMYPDFSAQLMREIAYFESDGENEYIFDCSFVRLSKKIGEYDMEADFILDLVSC